MTTRWKRMSLLAATLGLLGLGTVQTARAEADKKTVRLFKAKCASCHGEDGTGKTEQGGKMGIGDMTAAAYWKDLTDDKIKKTILDGFKREKGGKAQEMKPFKDQIPADQLDGIVAYVKAFKK